jgi:hypothetical protein
MANVQKSIDVDRPRSTVYNQWTQFEEFPEFMEGILEVQQLDDKRLHWIAEIGGHRKEWNAEILEQEPDQRISWRSISGAPNAGTVTFEPLGDNHTRVNLSLEYEPEGAMENMGDAMGLVSRRIEGDLERFKEFIETRRVESGGWRGEVRAGEVQSTTSTSGRIDWESESAAAAPTAESRLGSKSSSAGGPAKKRRAPGASTVGPRKATTRSAKSKSSR